MSDSHKKAAGGSLTHFLAWAVLLAAMASIATATYWTVSPYDVITHSADSFSVTNKGRQVAQGDTLWVWLDFCKKIDVDYTISVTLVGPVMYPLPEHAANHPVGCYKKQEALVDIPPQLVPGTYYARVTKRFKVNPIREEVKVWETSRFEVVPAKRK